MSFKLENIRKSYRGQAVLRGINLELPLRQCLSILGQSGCGKTTLLKILAGLEQADQGRVAYDGKYLEHTPASQRGLVYLYQEALLFPYLNVFENIAFGLRLRKRPRREIKQRVHQLLDDLGLSGLEQQFPHTLSGGQKQRVAFGRALVIHPRVLLLDEPFGALDAQTRQEMQQLFIKISSREHITSLFVTHDPREALVVGHKMALMREGHLRVYDREADFLQDPATGLPGELRFWDRLNQELQNKSNVT